MRHHLTTEALSEIYICFQSYQNEEDWRLTQKQNLLVW